MTKKNKFMVVGLILIIIIVVSVFLHMKNTNEETEKDKTNIDLAEYKDFTYEEEDRIATDIVTAEEEEKYAEEREKFFDIDSVEYKDFAYEDGSSITTDIVTITLDSYIYDYDAKMALCKFSIRQNDGENDMLLTALRFRGSIGVELDDMAYGITPLVKSSGGRDAWCKLEGNVLYYYLRFYEGYYLPEYTDMICIDDSRTDNWADYYFEIKGTEGITKTYSGSQGIIKVSPLGLIIEWHEEITDVVICTNETEHVLVKDRTTDVGIAHNAGVYQSKKDCWNRIIGFHEVYNLNEIDKVIINGTEYMVE